MLAIAGTLAVRYPEDPDGQILLGGARHAAGDWGRRGCRLRASRGNRLAGQCDPRVLLPVVCALGGIGAAYVWWDSAGAAERTARRFIAIRPHEEIAWSALVEPLLRLGRRKRLWQPSRNRIHWPASRSRSRGLLQRDLIRWGGFELDRQLLDDLVSSSGAVRARVAG